MTPPLMTMAASARAAIQDPGRTTVVGDSANPRFELFHAASSLCSQKVRTVMHEKALPYRSNDMLILSSMGPDGLVPAEHYSPAYIRLRLLAARGLDLDFVSGYSGRTSVETEGFDVRGAVAGGLPGRSRGGGFAADLLLPRRGLERAGPARAGRSRGTHRGDAPGRHRRQDSEWGAALRLSSDADRRPDPLKSSMETVYDYKIMVLERLIATHADDAELVAACRAKIAKESGGKKVCRDPAFQRAARQTAGDLLKGLERDLEAKSFSCLFGNASRSPTCCGASILSA